MGFSVDWDLYYEISKMFIEIAIVSVGLSNVIWSVYETERERDYRTHVTEM